MTKVIWVILAVLVIFFAGMAMATQAPPQPVERQSLLSVLDEAFTHPVCLAPFLTLFCLGMVLGGARFVVWLKHTQLDLQERALRIEQARQTITQTRVLADAAGRPVLVSPDLMTRPITALDAEEEMDSEQLRAARILANAWRRSGGPAAPGAPPPLWMTPVGERVPPEVHILPPDEACIIKETTPS